MAGALLVGVTIKSDRLREIIGAVGVVCGITFFIYNERTIFPGWTALVPVLGSSLMILTEGSFFSRIVLAHPLAAAVGYSRLDADPTPPTRSMSLWNSCIP